jgi:DNA-binding transcriptional LysR family regulator
MIHRMPAQFSRMVRRLRLRHFELLTLLAQERTVRAAARRMALTQPAISKMLKEIEDCFGTPLFERSRTGVMPNAAGERLIRHAVLAINETRSLGEEVDAIAGHGASTLRVGTLPMTPRIPEAIARLRARAPRIVVQVREARIIDLIPALRDGEVDCVVGGLPPEALQAAETDKLRIETLAADQILVVASPRHRLSGRRRFHWRQLEGEQWVLPPRHSMLRRAISDAHHRAGLTPPEPDVELMSPFFLTTLLSLDPRLLGVMRKEHALVDAASGALCIIPVSPSVALPSIAFITRRRHRSEALSEFAAALRKSVGSK